MIECPYCKCDVTIAHEALKGNKKMFAAVLCPACGEPSVRTDSGFRKPTPDEHVSLHNDRNYQSARASWLEVEKLRRQKKVPPILNGWRTFAKMVDGIFKTPNERSVAMVSFMSGARVGVDAMMAAIEEADDSEEFDALAGVINAELNGFGETLKAFLAKIENKETKK